MDAGPRDQFESTGTVMGTVAHVVLRGDGAPEHELDELRRLDSRWSRFLATSELSRLGALEGAPAVVSPETALLLARSVEAWRRTGGLFDPTLLGALEAAGYDRSFELLDRFDPTSAPGSTPLPDDVVPSRSGSAPSDATGARPRVGAIEDVEVDLRTGLVRLPPGVRIDPGGLGKGLAADLVALGAQTHGARGALVSVGGDLRAVGEAPAQGWEIELDHHVVAPARVNLHEGAVATSSVLRRRWRTDGGSAHHVIDPRTGRSSTGPAVAVSVVAAEAWWAEAVATAMLVGFGTSDPDDMDPDLLRDVGVLVTTADGCQHLRGDLAHVFALAEAGAVVTAPAGTTARGS